jgi:hypothetical protein
MLVNLLGVMEAGTKHLRAEAVAEDSDKESDDLITNEEELEECEIPEASGWNAKKLKIFG